MKSTKHSDRRLEVTAAAWRVIIHEGLDRASIRAIAQELDATTAVVTHYFRNKNELILFVLEQVFQNLFEDIHNSVVGKQGLERLEAMLLSALPCSDRGADGWQVWIAFLGYAIGRESLLVEHKKRYDFLEHILFEELTNLQSAQLVRQDIDLRSEAKALIAFVDGIGTGCVIVPGQFSPEQQCYLVQKRIQTMATIS